MNKPIRELEEARGIRWRYYERMMRQIAEDVVSERETIDSDKNQADDLLKKHFHRLNHATTVLAHLASLIECKKPAAPDPLAPGEFRCFGCGKTIKNDDTKCLHCGWAWKSPGA